MIFFYNYSNSLLTIPSSNPSQQLSAIAKSMFCSLTMVDSSLSVELWDGSDNYRALEYQNFAILMDGNYTMRLGTMKNVYGWKAKYVFIEIF